MVSISPYSNQTMRRAGVLGALQPQPTDLLLELISLYRADPRARKIDVGVGVYRNEAGVTPVLRAVKEAERRLLVEQDSKSYLGAAGDIHFCELLRPLIFGSALASDRRIVGIQAPGGTGALRLAAELIGRARPDATVHLGLPTWPVHHSVFTATRLAERPYDYVDLDRQAIRFDAMMAALGAAVPGDAVLLHAACHNPTGADLNAAQWRAVAEICAVRGLVPILDFAYQGFGDGMDEDAGGLRLVVAAVDEAIVTYSCDKNFGQYRDRVGAIYVKTTSPGRAAVVQGHLQAIARAMWSMPPDHGAAVVRLILEDATLVDDWQAELKVMRDRVNGVRQRLAVMDSRLAAIGAQRGLFSTLPLGAEKVALLAREDAIYMAVPGRINIAGLLPEQIERFGQCLIARL
jgi:aromatic-amino-acid transaminase